MSKALNTLDFDNLERWVFAADANIRGLVQNESQIIETLQILTDYCQRLEGRVQSLENIKLVVKPTGGKLFLLAACTFSAYAGYKYAEREFYGRNGNVRENYTKSRTNHPAGSKFENSNATSTDNSEKN